jgi:phage head maturation protease
VPGFSIGFRTVRDRVAMEQGQQIRELLAVDLFEISAVIAPANDQTALLGLREAPVEAPEDSALEEHYRRYFEAAAAGSPPVTPVHPDVRHFDRLIAELSR